MKEEQDGIEVTQSEVESKSKKYFKNAGGVIGGLLIAVILFGFVISVLRKCGM